MPRPCDATSVLLLIVGWLVFIHTESFKAVSTERRRHKLAKTKVQCLRSFLKTKLGNNKQDNGSATGQFDGASMALMNLNGSAASSTSSISKFPAAARSIKGVSANLQPSSKVAMTTTFVVSKMEEELLLDEPFSVAPANRQLTSLEQEFRDMLVDFSQFTPRDIRGVQNPTTKALFKGVAASYELPEVYRAFEVLHSDFLPFRLASRLTYQKMRQVMVESRNEQKKEVDMVSAATGMSKDEVDGSRSAFLELVAHLDGKGTQLTMQQLIDTGIAETAIDTLGSQGFDNFMSTLEPKVKDGKINFFDLMVTLHGCAHKGDPATVFPEVVRRLTEQKRVDDGNGIMPIWSLDQTKLEYAQRYDYMVEKFKAWEGFVPQGNRRRIDVLRGCFVGASSMPLVNALRIVYVEHRGLRFCGNLIFGLMWQFMSRQDGSTME